MSDLIWAHKLVWSGVMSCVCCLLLLCWASLQGTQRGKMTGCGAWASSEPFLLSMPYLIRLLSTSSQMRPLLFIANCHSTGHASLILISWLCCLLCLLILTQDATFVSNSLAHFSLAMLLNALQIPLAEEER